MSLSHPKSEPSASRIIRWGQLSFGCAVLLLIASCTIDDRTALDCANVALSENDEEEVQEIRQAIVNLCTAFDSTVAVTGAKTLSALEDDLRRKTDLLNRTAAVLQSSSEYLITDTIPEDTPLRAALERVQATEGLVLPETTFTALEEETLRQLRQDINRYLSDQKSVTRDLQDVVSMEDGGPIVHLLQLELALVDSAQTLLQLSNDYLMAVLAAPAQGDSLQQQLDRVRSEFVALQETNLGFLEDPAGPSRLGPLAGPADTRELVWQVRQAIRLQQEVQTILKSAHALLFGDSLGTLGYQIQHKIDRLDDILATQYTFPVSSMDSLRASGVLLQADTERQHQILDALQQHIPALLQLEAEAGIRAAGILRQSIELSGDVQSSLESTHAALMGSLVGDVQKYGGRLFFAILVVAVAFFVVRALVWLLETLAERSAARRLFYKKLVPIGRLTLWGLTAYVILANILQLDRNGLLAAATAVGVAIGFASQDILKNIFGGIIIIFDQPFQVGDKVNIGGTYGEVATIGLRSTRIVTPDDNLVTVPNAQVVDSQVFNSNAGELNCQVVIDLYLPGWVDMSGAKAIAYEAAASSKYVYLEKPIIVNVSDVFKETFLTRLRVKAYVLDTRYEFAFASSVTETAKAEFLRKGFFEGFKPRLGHDL